MATMCKRSPPESLAGLAECQTEIAELNRDFVSFLENTSDFIYFKDSNSRFRFCSQTLAKVTGHASWRDMIGKHDLEVFPPDTARIYHEEELPIFRDGKPLINKIDPYYDESGKPGWVCTNKWPVINDEGKVVGLFGISRDVTENKRIEAELDRHRHHLEDLVNERTAALSAAKEAAEAFGKRLAQANHDLLASTTTLEAALASMSDAVFISDTKGNFTHFNDAFATFHKFKDRDECARTLAEYPDFLDVYSMNGEHLPLEQWAVPRALRGESAANAEFALHRKDTDEKWIGSYNFAPIRDQDGVIVGSVVTGRDITATKRAEIVLLQAKEAAEAASKAKSIFLSTMSHELRTPLNGIMGMTALALRRATDPKQVEQLGKVAKASEHLLAIIKDVLDLSRIEADKLKLEQVEFSLDGVLENLEAMIRAQIGEKPLKLLIDLAPQVNGLSLRGDPRRLSQILLNLAGNAIKFSEAGLVTIFALLVEEQPTNVMLRFEVHDTGIGIAAAEQSRLFRAFEQIDGSATRKYGGSGLGLAISKRLVEMMDGAIGVDSKAGVGSIFWFTVRLAKAGHVAVAEPARAPHAAREQLRSQHAGAFILVVDDEPINREIAQGLLEDIDLVVHLADNGAKAVEMAKRVNYDLILMDVQMPVMDGLEATRSIRALPNNPRVPIIAFTANVFSDDEARCLDAGMNDFIGRPADSAVMFATMLKWLAQPHVGDRQ